MLTDIIITALLSAFIILLITKIGLRDFIIGRGPKLISKMFSCDFCLSFWVNVFIALIITASMGCLSFIIIPIFAAPITRILL